jgi:hypothetical protein
MWTSDRRRDRDGPSDPGLEATGPFRRRCRVVTSGFPDALLVVGLVILLMLVVLVPPSVNLEPSAAAPGGAHARHCPMCRLPAFGRPGKPSRYGPAPGVRGFTGKD